jgi:hypothetical protein
LFTPKMTTTKRRLAVGIPVILLLVFAMGQIDFVRVVRGKNPFFARWKTHPADGGSAEYRFIGYTVTHSRRLECMTLDGPQYRVGPKLDFWLPFVGRDRTVLIVRTNRPAVNP